MKKLLVAMLAFALPLAAAQAPSPPPTKPWPWDHRPHKCMGPGAQALPGTACATVPDWPTYYVTSQHVHLLFIDQPDFDQIERAENELAYSNAQFDSGDYLFEAWIAGMGFGRSVEKAAELIQRWKETKGVEGFAPVAEAMLWHERAWAARGTGFASTVTPEAWALFHKNLAKADAALDSVSPKVRKSGPWYLLKVKYAFEGAQSHAQGEKLAAEAATHWPDSVSIAILPMEFAAPKWGGSFEAMDAAARTATKRAKRLGKGMYPLLYAFASWQQGQYTLADTKADWSMMKAGFRALEPLSTSPGTWQQFAKFACDMKDRDEAKRLYLLRDARRAADPDASGSFDDESDTCHIYAFGTKDA